jgi:hypothetical protein
MDSLEISHNTEESTTQEGLCYMKSTSEEDGVHLLSFDEFWLIQAMWLRNELSSNIFSIDFSDDQGRPFKKKEQAIWHINVKNLKSWGIN